MERRKGKKAHYKWEDYLHKAIRLARLDKRLTVSSERFSQESVARQLSLLLKKKEDHFKQSYISRVESGTDGVSAKRLTQLCEVLGCRVSEVVMLAELLAMSYNDPKKVGDESRFEYDQRRATKTELDVNLMLNSKIVANGRR